MDRQALLRLYTENLGWSLAYLDGKNPEKTMGKGWPEKGITQADKFPNGHNIGLIHCKSGTATLDIDHAAARTALAAVGVDLDSLLNNAPYKIIGDEANPPKPVYHVPDGVKLETKQLRWPDPGGKLNQNGSPALIIIFELRGGSTNSQDVLPDSIHPDTGTVYRWANGNIPSKPEAIPELPASLLMLWQNWDSLLPKMQAACPWVDLTPTKAKQTNSQNHNSDFAVDAVQIAFNQRYTPADVLERNGYKRRGDEWLCPNSSTGNPGVKLMRDGLKIKSYHGSDILGDGKPHDAYDLSVILEYGGDYTKAWHEIKEKLGITFSQNGNGNHNSGTPAAIIEVTDNPPDEMIEGVEAEPEPDESPALLFQPLTFQELLSRPPKNWLIKNIIGPGDLGMIFGDSGTGKTFLVIDLIMSVITGLSWARRFEIAEPLTVAYCTNEGLSGLPDRFRAAQQWYQASDEALERFTAYEMLPQLFNADAALYISRFVRDYKAARGEQLDLLVIDTLDNASLGSKENDNSDASVIADATRIARDSLGCATILIHHAGKSGEYRGASAYKGDCDIMIKTERKSEESAYIEFSCYKSKDEEKFEPLVFTLYAPNEANSRVISWQGLASENLGKTNELLAAMEEMSGQRLLAKQWGEAISVTQSHAIAILNGLYKQQRISRELQYADKKKSSRNPFVYYVQA